MVWNQKLSTTGRSTSEILASAKHNEADVKDVQGSQSHLSPSAIAGEEGDGLPGCPLPICASKLLLHVSIQSSWSDTA